MADQQTAIFEAGNPSISAGGPQGKWNLPSLNVKTDENEKGKMTTTSNLDLSHPDVEEMVRRLTMNEMKNKWFVDEIVSKVKTEREYVVNNVRSRLIGSSCRKSSG